MKNLSQNDLEELLDLAARLQNEISNYRHVSEHLPDSITKELDKFQSDLYKESYRREDEF